MPKSVKLKLKGGGYVDPESGLEDKVRNSNILCVFYLFGFLFARNLNCISILEFTVKKSLYLFFAFLSVQFIK
jgi:hypothetical protein